jgi:NADH dehydrogenase FAD-containing subunit
MYSKLGLIGLVGWPMKVTIVTASSRLLTFLGSKASDKCLKWFKSKKVDVIFNDK